MRARLQISKPPHSAPLKEWHLQAAQVTALRRARQAGWPIRVEGDMNAGRRTLRETGIAAATGINSGAADLRVFLPAGKLLMVENKRRVNGKSGALSKDQKESHAEFAELGHDIIVVVADTPDDAAAQVMAAVSKRLGLPVPRWEPPQQAANDDTKLPMPPETKKRRRRAS